LQYIFVASTIIYMTTQIINNGIPEGFGSRLKLERKRLKLSQEQFALIGGVQRVAQIQYENENTSPTIRYLNLIGNAGVDLMFLLHGIYTDPEPLPRIRMQAIENKTFELIDAYAETTSTGKMSADMFRMLFNLIRNILIEVDSGKLPVQTDILSIIKGQSG